MAENEIANDNSYDMVFAWTAEGLMKEKDILFGINTSENSENIYVAIPTAKKWGKTIAFTGNFRGQI